MNPELRDTSASDAFLASPNVLAEHEFLAREAEFGHRFAEARRHYASETAEVVARNRQKIEFQAGGELFRRPNDAFSYQRRVIELEQRGVDDAELAPALAASEHQIRTGLQEYFNSSTWDLSDAMLYDITPQGRIALGPHHLDDMSDNGLTPACPPQELQRRAHERSTLRAWQDMLHEPDAPARASIEISLFNPEENAPGYNADNKKMQIRYMRPVDTDDGRKMLIQSFYMDGREMDEAFMNEFLVVIGERHEEDETLNHVELLDNPIFVDSQEIDGPLAFARLLDEFREKTTGRPTMVGRDRREEPGLHYELIPHIVAERNELLVEAIDDMHAYSLNLMRDGHDYAEATQLFKQYQKMWALRVCKDRPELARLTFDEETYRRLLEVNVLEKTNLHDAGMAFADAFEQAPDGNEGCGDMCSIVPATEAQTVQAMQKGLSAFELTGLMYYDSSVRCGSCGKVGVVYSGSGQLCANGCGQARQNKQSNQGRKSNTSFVMGGDASGAGNKKPLIKSFRLVQTEYELNQARRAEELTRAKS